MYSVDLPRSWRILLLIVNASIPLLPPSPTVNNNTNPLIINWQNTSSSSKSDAEINLLVDEVMLGLNFNVEESHTFKAVRENGGFDGVARIWKNASSHRFNINIF